MATIGGVIALAVRDGELGLPAVLAAVVAVSAGPLAWRACARWHTPAP
jgi:hypothetical protein